MQQFWKRSLCGNWIPVKTDSVNVEKKIILYRKDILSVFCPNHCRWEYAAKVSDFEVITSTGEQFSHMVFPFLELSQEGKHLVLNEDTRNENGRLSSLRKMLEDSDGISQDTVLFSINTEGEIVRTTQYSLDRKKIESAKKGGFELCALRLLPYQMNYEFNKKRAHGKSTESLIPKAIVSAVNEEMKKLALNQLKKKITFPYPVYDLKNLNSYFASPYELNVYPLKRLYIDFEDIEADDPNAYNKACDILEIKSNTTLRKAFAKNPFSLIRFKIMQYLGFKDMNVIALSLGKGGDFFFKKFEKDYATWSFSKKDNIWKSNLKLAMSSFDSKIFFIQKSLEVRSEKSTWKKISVDTGLDSHDRSDFFRMFRRNYEQLERKTQLEIIRGGVSRENHDILSKIDYALRNKNFTFNYKPKQYLLEDTIGGWNFSLPKDSYQLKDIGCALHNCVASYKDKVIGGECTIVYAEKDSRYRLCIEVRENHVHQCRADHNQNPYGDELNVFNKWIKSHNLTFTENRY